MATVDEALQTQLKNIEAQYGKPLAHWFKLIKESGLTKHNEVVALLKTKHGMAHGAAHRVSLQSRASDSPAEENSSADPAAALYAGKKAPLLPIHETLMAAVRALGEDVEIAPKSGYLSLRRKKQFAMLKPAAKHVDVGLILKGVEPGKRLESAASFNALFTHRVRVADVKEVDRELIGWLTKAYKAAGK